MNRRGAEPDVAKVLDFGLVKAFDEQKEVENCASGTPLYMSPEAFQTADHVDPRSDLYAVGAAGYFLLTGQPEFADRTLREVLQQHATTIPDSPSQRLRRPVSAELEYAILACLEKNRVKRPQTARALAAILERVAAPWGLDEVEARWSRHERGQVRSHISARIECPAQPAPAGPNERTVTIFAPLGDTSATA